MFTVAIKIVKQEEKVRDRCGAKPTVTYQNWFPLVSFLLKATYKFIIKDKI